MSELTRDEVEEMGSSLLRALERDLGLACVHLEAVRILRYTALTLMDEVKEEREWKEAYKHDYEMHMEGYTKTIAERNALVDGNKEMAAALKTLAKKESTWAHQEEMHAELRVKDAADYRAKINHVKAERDALAAAHEGLREAAEKVCGLPIQSEFVDIREAALSLGAALATDPTMEV